MTDAPRTVAQALAFAQAEHDAETQDWTGYCQRFVRSSYGLPSLFGSAKAQWFGADEEDRHAGGRIEDAPVGSGLVFSGGTFWHIDLAAHPLGDIDRAWSNDLVRTGDIDIVDRSLATTKWGYPFVGYLSAINDFDLQLKTGKPPKPRQDKHYLRVRTAIEKLEAARDNAKRLGERRDVKIFNTEIRDLEELYAELEARLMNRLILAVWLGLAAGIAKLRSWPELALATWNIGPARHLPEQLLHRIPAAVALQEASDQWGKGDIIALLRRVGYRLISGTEAGQKATPLAYDPARLRLVKIKKYLLAEDQDAGPGAGPDHVKQKWAIGGLFEILGTGRLVWIFADHTVASVQHRRRFLLARKMASQIALLGHRLRRVMFDMGDKNDVPGGRSLAPLRAAGWLMNQTIGRMFGTHGKRAIDQIWWQARRWIRFLRHQVIGTESDHDLVIAWFAIKPRRKAAA